MNSTGAAIPLMVTETSPIDNGSGVPVAEAAAGAKPEPNIEISDPGAMASGEKVAPSVSAVTTGAAAATSPYTAKP
jgi:hypothetical protein